jgi:dsDNA-specific endonuclease/ATPase MutS2
MHGDEEPLRIPITDVFDLHTVEPREVAVVEAYLDEAARLGFDTVRITHGRGTGVQQRIVCAVLARTPFVSSYRDAPPEAGGCAAIIVSLHRSSREPGAS